jgi:hypothetical protein
MLVTPISKPGSASGSDLVASVGQAKPGKALLLRSFVSGRLMLMDTCPVQTELRHYIVGFEPPGP